MGISSSWLTVALVDACLVVSIDLAFVVVVDTRNYRHAIIRGVECASELAVEITQIAPGYVSISTFGKIVASTLRKGVKGSELLRCLIRPSLRHEKQRSFLFSRVDLLNRTDPGEAVRNVEYML